MTVPWIVKVPSGKLKLWNGIVQVTPDSGAAFEVVSVSVNVGPPDGVKVVVMLNESGMKTDVAPTRCAGVNSPCPRRSG